ncbi:MAG: hypothetical protein WC371_04550, partial [Parachlamydiales bacterium]
MAGPTLMAIFQPGDLCYGFQHLENAEVIEIRKKFALISVKQRLELAFHLKNLCTASDGKEKKIKASQYLEEIPENLRSFYQELEHSFSAFEKVFFSWTSSYSARIQKICKIYLLWACRFNYRVHFLLDEINQRYAAEKDDPYERALKNMQRFDPYYVGKNYLIKNIATHSELRFIYRNRFFLNQTVLFWKTDPDKQQLTRVPPPWEWPSEEKTAAYDLERERMIFPNFKEPAMV